MIEDAKKNAAALYESCAFDRLLGDALRPGGLHLSARLAQIAGISARDTILDIACGKGTTAFFLAREYHCSVTGIDLSAKMISCCQNKAVPELGAETSFLLGDAENLPFHDSSFTTVVSECSFSLLPNKETAAREIWRVLRPGGKLVMTDIILRGDVDDRLRGQINFACCLAGARSIEEYTSLFEQAGFRSFHIEDHSPELRKVAYRLGTTFGSTDNFLTAIPPGPCEIKKGPLESSTPSLQAYQQFLKTGRPGYALLTMTKE